MILCFWIKYFSLEWNGKIQMRNVNYRPDVDALRGLSVLLVVIFHTFPSLIPGGFIGVDVFFVISDYLITSLILKSLKKGDFSIKEFLLKKDKKIVSIAYCRIVSGFNSGLDNFTPS
jgi:peptidoglycan/LPS O-acetylase OafA/YrhL